MTDDDGRPYRLPDPTGAGVRRGETGLVWRGIDVTAKGRHWAYPPAVLDELETDGRLVFNSRGVPRLKRYLDELAGIQAQDVWTDIGPVNSAARERLGYPTQKPEPLV
jgi:site-specific DNA-methyltransferase (adenine-specific)